MNIVRTGAILLTGLVLWAAGMLLSMKFGSSAITFEDIWSAVTGARETKQQLIVYTLRLPRALLAALVGANLAVAGVLMQAVTRNPLASPQIFGINSGAALVVVGSVVFYPMLTPLQLSWCAFLGAALGAAIVYFVASGGGSFTPVKLALAGMTVAMLLSALTEGIIVLFDNKTQNVLFWMAGAVDSADWNDVRSVLPWSAAGLLAAVLLSRSMNALGLGDEVAKGIGVRMTYVRALAGIVVVVLAGASVSVAGPIGFVGLIVPHISRYLVGIDHWRLIPVSALFGAILLVYADIASRFVSFPFESPVGIVTAAIGAPYFLYLVRKGRQTE
nr:iron ABC transporter permease [Paenibacillus hamazuiensis]